MTGQQRALTPLDCLGLPMNLLRRRPEYSERADACTGKICKLHPERSRSESLVILLYLKYSAELPVTNFKVYRVLESPSWKPQIFSFIPAVWAALKVQESLRSSGKVTRLFYCLFYCFNLTESSFISLFSSFAQILHTFYFKYTHDSLSTLTGVWKVLLVDSNVKAGRTSPLLHHFQTSEKALNLSFEPHFAVLKEVSLWLKAFFFPTTVLCSCKDIFWTGGTLHIRFYILYCIL